MTLPITFGGDPEKAIATFDFDDIQNGTGTVTYNILTTRTDSVTGYTLLSDSTNTSTRDTEMTTAGRDFTLTGFKFPRTIEGDAIFEVTTATTSSSTGAEDIIVEVLKNTTSIASVSNILPGASGVQTNIMLLTLPQTHFKIGDQLIINISVGGGAPFHAFIEHDTLNRDQAGYTPPGGIGNLPAVTAASNPTKARAFIPFKIDL